MRTNKIPYKFINRVEGILTLILFFKVAGYFTIIEDRTITQIFKVISRIGMTIYIILIYRKLKKIGCLDTLKYDNVLGPFFYILYLLLGVASFAWSTKPSYSSLQWLMTFESFVFVLIYIKTIMLYNLYFPKKSIDLIKVFSKAIFFILAILLIGSLIDPDMFYREMRGGEEIRFGGYLMNPNELGMLASIGAAVAYLLMLKSKKKLFPIFMLLTAVLTLALTTSRSSMIGFIVIIGILILKSENKQLKMAMVVLSFLGIPFVLKYVIFKEGGGVEEVMSMTGRLPFWKALLNEGIVKEPFFGYGFMRINYIDTFQGLNTYPGKMTHNTFMQVLMNLGFVGFFIAFWQVVLTVRNYVVEKENIYRDFFIAMFIPVIINSFTEFGVFGDANYGILFYQFLILLFVLKPRNKFTSIEKLALKKFNQKIQLSKTN